MSTPEQFGTNTTSTYSNDGIEAIQRTLYIILPSAIQAPPGEKAFTV